MLRMSSAVLPSVLQLLAQRHGRFHSCLRVELGREADLEEHVLHHVAAIRALEFERAALEGDVVEAPGLCSKHGGVAHFAGLRHQRKAHGAAGGVARGPALARAGIGRVPIGAQALAIDPGKRERIDGLLAGEAEQLAHHGGGRDLDQNHVIEADFVEGVLQRNAALDLVRLDHGGQHIAHDERRLARWRSRCATSSPRRPGCRRDYRRGGPTRRPARCR